MGPESRRAGGRYAWHDLAVRGVDECPVWDPHTTQRKVVVRDLSAVLRFAGQSPVQRRGCDARRHREVIVTVEASEDQWATWLAHRRHGGDPEQLRRALEFLAPIRPR